MPSDVGEGKELIFTTFDTMIALAVARFRLAGDTR